MVSKLKDPCIQISVVIPCFNHSKYVVECIKSVVNAFSGKLQIVFCDDSSSDDSYSVAYDLLKDITSQKDNVSYICLRNNTNIGVCTTLNRCLSYATGVYVYVIASDDFLLPRSLDNAYKKIESECVDAIIHDCSVVDENSKTIYNSALFEFRNSSKPRLESDQLVSEIVMNWTIPGPSLLLKKSVYDEIGLYDVNLLAEDRDFYLRLLAFKKVRFSEQKIACYRIHSSNAFTSTKFSTNIHKEQSGVNFKYRKHFSGILKIYLLSFGVDYKYGRSFLMSLIRKVFYYTIRITKLS
ncbi:glycosyltransferase [Shewanella sp. 10N.286.45.A1]|uniref:glycosyltransferase n=1 Tax=Shewanella sp. 10N.286.45.A1 TaxID=3229694 RepID=UPI003551FB70